MGDLWHNCGGNVSMTNARIAAVIGIRALDKCTKCTGCWTAASGQGAEPLSKLREERRVTTPTLLRPEGEWPFRDSGSYPHRCWRGLSPAASVVLGLKLPRTEMRPLWH